MIVLLTVPLILAAAFFLLGCCSVRFSRSGIAAPPQKLVLPFLAAAGEILLFLLTWVIQHFWMSGETFHIPLPVVLLFCAAVDTAVYVHIWSENKQMRRLLRRIALVGVVLFAAEIVVFNAKSFTLHKQSELIKPARMSFDDDDISFRENGYIVLGSGSVVQVYNLPDWTRCVTFQMEQQPDQSPIRVKFLFTDNNFLQAPQVCGHKLISTYGEDLAFAVLPYEKLRMTRTEFFDVCAPVRLYSMTCMSSMPFSFSWMRFCGLFVILALFLFLKDYRLADVTYDRTKSTHRIVTGVMVILCVLSASFFWIPGEELVSYPNDFDLEAANPYEQTLDAFESGHAWLNLPVDPRLEKLDFVFDRMERDASKIPYLFDHALYDGKYYSYFGIAPVVTFYYPVYWLTGKLPTMKMTCMFYAPFTILLLCLSLLTAVRLCCKKPNFLLLLMSMPVSTALCGVYYCLQFPNQYDVVVASGLCFLMLALWSGMQACVTEKKWQRYVLFAVCGIGCVFCVQSRPSMALTTLILAPFFIGVLRDKAASVKSRIAQAASFGIPVMAGAAATMYYNAIRFSSPLNFGAGYQLTISNIQANQMRLSALPAAIYHYLLQPLTARPYFPFFTLSFHALDNYHMYNNLEHTVGAITFPVIFLAVILCPKLLKSRSVIGGAVAPRQGKAMLLLTGALTVVIAWLDFCMGGVSLRYSTDFMPILMIGTTVIILSLIRDPRRYAYHIAWVAYLVTFALIWLLMAQVYTEGAVETTLTLYHPTVHELLADAFCFWE